MGAYVHREHLIHMLAANFTAEDIAAKLGVDAALVIDAIDADENIAFDVARVKHYRQIDNNLDKIESTAASRLLQAVAMETDSMKLLKITTGINQARRRSQGETADFTRAGASQGKPSVRLRLPKRVEVTHERNLNNEVVSVNDRALVTMPASELLKKVKSDDTAKIEQQGRLPKELKQLSEEEAASLVEKL